MRQIGTIENEHDARRFAAYLVTQGIEAQADAESEAWTIWVRDEDQRQQAKDELQRFQSDPTDPRYVEAEREANQLMRQRVQRQQAARRNYVDVRRRWQRAPVMAGPRPPVVTALVLLSLIVTLSGWFGRAPERSLGEGIYSALQFSDAAEFWKSRDRDPFVSIERGQIWRLVTPIFLHYHLMHILFNMMVFYYFGKQVELLRGPLVLASLVVVTAVVSNAAQAYFQGPFFGGMSGVGYGLFGYVWMQHRTHPEAGFVMDSGMVVISLAWFFLCWFGVIAGVANYAHAGGLVAGMLLGLAASLRNRSFG